MELDIYLEEAEVGKSRDARDEESSRLFRVEWDRAREALAADRGVAVAEVENDHKEIAARLDRTRIPVSDGRDADRPSERFPDHLFKRTYLRSPYNDGGFDRVVPRLLDGEIGSLGWIFEEALPDSEDAYQFEPPRAALQAARDRAQQVVEGLRDRLKDPAGLLDVCEVHFNPFLTDNGKTAHEAIELARAALVPATDRPEGFRSYSNRDGDFFLDGLEVLAAIPGKSVLGAPSFNLVYRQTPESYEWYVQAAEIVVEFIDEALAMQQPRITWSG